MKKYKFFYEKLISQRFPNIPRDSHQIFKKNIGNEATFLKKSYSNQKIIGEYAGNSRNQPEYLGECDLIYTCKNIKKYVFFA